MNPEILEIQKLIHRLANISTIVIITSVCCIVFKISFEAAKLGFSFLGII